jgi:hypothetical protein
MYRIRSAKNLGLPCNTTVLAAASTEKVSRNRIRAHDFHGLQLVNRIYLFLEEKICQNY